MITTSFSAAHALRNYGGRCEQLHGHNWRVDVYVRADHLNEIGLAIDFKTLKEKANSILKELDHTFLNEHPYFKDLNPSSEHIARYVFETLSKELNIDEIRVSRVTAWESDGAFASYYEG